MDPSRPQLVVVLAVIAVVTVGVLVVVALLARQLTRRTRTVIGGTAAVLTLAILGTGWYAWSTSSHHDTIDINALTTTSGAGLTLDLTHERLSTSGDEYDFALLRGSDASDVHDALVATGTSVDPVPGGWTLVKDGLRYTVVERDDGTWRAENKKLTVAHGNDLTSIAFPTTPALHLVDAGTPVTLPVPAADVRAELTLLGAVVDGTDTLVVPTDDGRTARLTFDGDVMTADVVGDAPA